MLKTRIITAVCLLPPLLFLIYWWPESRFHWFLAPILGVVMWEWARMSGPVSMAGRVAWGLLIAGSLAYFSPVVGTASDVIAMVSATGLVWFICSAWLAKPALGAEAALHWLVLKLAVGAMICLLAGIALYHVFQFQQGRLWLLTLLLIIWAADVGAYFTGKAFGKHKLAPSISPGKTWEGVVGGLVLAGVVGAVMGHYLPMAWPKLALIAVGTAGISVVGDLMASLLKRQAGLKDSSQLLPGHGGAVDRLDSLLAAAPVFYCAAILTL